MQMMMPLWYFVAFTIVCSILGFVAGATWKNPPPKVPTPQNNLPKPHQWRPIGDVPIRGPVALDVWCTGDAETGAPCAGYIRERITPLDIGYFTHWKITHFRYRMPEPEKKRPHIEPLKV